MASTPDPLVTGTWTGDAINPALAASDNHVEDLGPTDERGRIPRVSLMRTDFLSGVHRVVYVLVAVVFAVASLRMGRELLIPLAMASLLTFLLRLPVSWLERHRVPRVPAVLLVMLVISAVGIAIGASTVAQLNEMATRLPAYKDHLQQKLNSLKLSGGRIGQIQKAVDDLSGSLSRQAEEVQPVRIVSDNALPWDQIKLALGTFVEPLANAAIVLVLVIFMLISREDMRNRLVRLAGTRFALTTRTLDEVGARISRYLLLNSLVNGGFGVAVGIGLALVGVEYAATWGFLAAMLRFVPYLGPILASILPVGMAFVQFPGADWLHPLLAASVFVLLELVTNNVVEPLVYGPTTGVSAVALIVSAMFWTWVWGPLGLVLAIPLTVVFAVLGEYVDALEPLAILLGDKPPLENSITYYQRLLAMDADEAATILESSRNATSLIAAYDNVVIPAFVLAQKEHESGELPEQDQQFIWQTTQEIIDELQPAKDLVASESTSAPAELTPGQTSLNARVVGCPAHDIADQMALEMLKQGLVIGSNGAFDILPVTMLASEMIAAIGASNPDAVCVSSVGPYGGRQTRYLCKRIRQAYPEMRIVVGRWGYGSDRERMATNLKARGADVVVVALAEALDLLQRMAHLGDDTTEPGPADTRATRSDPAKELMPAPAAKLAKMQPALPIGRK